MAKFREQGGLVVTKHTSRSLPLQRGLGPGLGGCADETVGDYAGDTMGNIDLQRDTDLQLELGMETTQDSEVVGGDTTLLRQVAQELTGLAADLRGVLKEALK